MQGGSRTAPLLNQKTADAAFLNAIACAHLQFGRNHAAHDFLQLSEQIDPDSQVTWALQCIVLLRMGDLEAAKVKIEEMDQATLSMLPGRLSDLHTKNRGRRKSA